MCLRSPSELREAARRGPLPSLRDHSTGGLGTSHLRRTEPTVPHRLRRSPGEKSRSGHDHRRSADPTARHRARQWRRTLAPTRRCTVPGTLRRGSVADPGPCQALQQRDPGIHRGRPHRHIIHDSLRSGHRTRTGIPPGRTPCTSRRSRQSQTQIVGNSCRTRRTRSRSHHGSLDTGCPKPARMYIQASHAYGKVHMLHQKLPGFTACGWVWARTGAATPLAAVTPDQPKCSRCFTRDVSPPTSVSSGDD